MQRGGRAIKEEEGTTFEQLKQRASAAPLPHLAQSSGDKFVVGDRRGGGRRRPAQHSDKMVLKNRNMGMMGEKLSSILGPTYFAGIYIYIYIYIYHRVLYWSIRSNCETKASADETDNEAEIHWVSERIREECLKRG